MGEQTIGIGAAANDGTGDTIRAAFDKVNDNLDTVQADTEAVLQDTWTEITFATAFADTNYQFMATGWSATGNPVSVQRRNKLAGSIEVRAALACDVEYIAKAK